jgi:hypothetical protein
MWSKILNMYGIPAPFSSYRMWLILDKDKQGSLKNVFSPDILVFHANIPENNVFCMRKTTGLPVSRLRKSQTGAH